MTRQYGSAAASIRSVELVSADGNVLQVDEGQNADLFWGLRGGGGNFGIVTSLECELYPVKEVFAGQVAYPIEVGNQILAAYFDWAKTVPDEVTSRSNFGAAHYELPPTDDLPPALRGKLAVIIMASYNGDARLGEAILAPMRQLGKSLLDTFALIAYSQIATVSGDPDKAPPVFVYNDGGGFGVLTANQIATLVSTAGDPSSGLQMVEIRQLGGALGRQGLPGSIRLALSTGSHTPQ